MSIWYMFLVALIIVFIGGVFLSPKIKDLLKNIFNKAPLIKRYWAFSIPFVVTSGTIYIVVYKYSSEQHLSNNINMVGQILTIIFAIFVGYFAFLQVSNSQFEKIKEMALIHFKSKNYLRAKEYYESAFKINPRDFPILAELLEIYVINNDFKNFDSLIDRLEKISLENREKAACGYLKITKSLFKQDLLVAKSEVKKLITFIDENPETLNHRVWDFSDIVGSDTYLNLTGDPKLIFDNLIAYITKRLPEDKRKRFEGGDYTLSMLDLTQK